MNIRIAAILVASSVSLISACAPEAGKDPVWDAHNTAREAEKNDLVASANNGRAKVVAELPNQISTNGAIFKACSEGILYAVYENRMTNFGTMIYIPDAPECKPAE